MTGVTGSYMILDRRSLRGTRLFSCSRRPARTLSRSCAASCSPEVEAGPPALHWPAPAQAPGPPLLPRPTAKTVRALCVLLLLRQAAVECPRQSRRRPSTTRFSWAPRMAIVPRTSSLLRVLTAFPTHPHLPLPQPLLSMLIPLKRCDF